LFKKNRAILIFSEGDSYPQKGVRRFKNGTCNMAIDLYQRGEGNLDLYVVPCGLNYTFFGFGRRRIQLSFQQAIRMKDFESKFESDPRKLSIELTKSLQESIEVLVVNNMNERADLVDRAQVMALNSVTEPMFFLQKNSRADSSVQICNNISSDLLQYEALLKQYKIGDRNVLGNGFNYPALFLSIFTAAVAIPAFLLNFINWYLAAYYTNKMVKNNVFRDSIYFGIGLVGTIILMIIICTLSLLLFNTLWAWICIIAAITGMITWFNAVEELDVMLAELRFLGLSREKKTEVRSL
jgi:hypothetical protein